jgi:hypothetical protein
MRMRFDDSCKDAKEVPKTGLGASTLGAIAKASQLGCSGTISLMFPSGA